MHKYTGIIGLAILIALMPHLGFPSDFDTIFYTASGLIIAVALYSSRRTRCDDCKKQIGGDEQNDTEYISDSERLE